MTEAKKISEKYEKWAHYPQQTVPEYFMRIRGRMLFGGMPVFYALSENQPEHRTLLVASLQVQCAVMQTHHLA